MKYVLIFLAFIALPLSVGWASYEVGKSMGEIREIAIVKEVPASGLDCYCEEVECETKTLPAMIDDSKIKECRSEAAACSWHLHELEEVCQMGADKVLELNETIRLKDVAMFELMKRPKECPLVVCE